MDSMSRWLVGSSSISRDGSRSRSFARAMRICQPPENSEHGRGMSEILNPSPIRTLSTRERSFDSSASSRLRSISPASETASAYSGDDGSAERITASARAIFSRMATIPSKADSASS